MRYLRSLLPAAVSACALAACGGGPIETPPTASVGGTVRNASTNQPVEGATVSAGSVQATTQSNGRFDLAGVPVGPLVTIRAQRPGFVAYARDIAVQEGSNTHDIGLTRQFLYESQGLAVDLPPNVASVRGVILGLGGADTRGLATDVQDTGDPEIDESQRVTRQLFKTLATRHGLAIMGSVPLEDNEVSDARVLTVLNTVAVASDHPELAQAPLFIWGISAAGPVSYGFTRRQPDRVIGFAVIIGVTPSTLRSPAAQRVPGYVLLAELDQVVDNGELTNFFEVNRAQGALWSFAIEPGAAHTALSFGPKSLIVNWMDTVLELRLPPTVPPGAAVALRSIDEASGWLGNRTTFAIAPYADYADNKLDASWFPSQATAQAWQGFVTPPPLP